ncbi:MAG: four helix bundle protein [Phycisphaerae bacterium]
MRRASVSIPSNIVEGCGRDGDRELGGFLRIVSGSASELEYQLHLARDLEMLDDQTCGLLMEQVAEVRRMIAGLLRTLKQDGQASKTTSGG